MTDVIQGAAVVMLGPDAGSLTDYSCYISEFVINEQRVLTVKSPSFGSPASEQKAGADTASVTMTYLAVPHGTSGLWWELRRARGTTTGELYFEVKYDNVAVSASNPKYTGYIVVSDLDTGAAGYTARRQSKTFPARAVSDPITS